MATSFAYLMAPIINVVYAVHPTTILELGCGLGKYGMLLNMYCGINPELPLDISTHELKQVSTINMDAIEINSKYIGLHHSQFYNSIRIADLESIDLNEIIFHDLILAIDVIEHLEKSIALNLIQSLFKTKCKQMLISSPIGKMHQDALFGSEKEIHISGWQSSDFRFAPYLEWQRLYGNGIYLLSHEPIDILGFGRSPVKRFRRLARAIVNEL